MAAITSEQSPAKLEHKGQSKLNVDSVVLGDVLIEPWYSSFYPKELVGSNTDRLYVCAWCFKYCVEPLLYARHAETCALKDGSPPGTLKYERDAISIHEIDGEEHKLYAQNLSLFAKLFLDTKSVFYDVTTFDYYIMSKANDRGSRQVVGFFSKEKMSWDNNNVACILVFPPWQRQGLGQVLIGISYELSRIEGRLGGPEKPLSALGKKGYGQYWCAAVCRSIMKTKSKRISVQQIVEDTFILAEDVIAALQTMGAVQSGQRGNGEFVLNHAVIKRWAATHEVLTKGMVSADAFVASPGSSSAHRKKPAGEGDFDK